MKRLLYENTATTYELEILLDRFAGLPLRLVVAVMWVTGTALLAETFSTH